jgi:GDP-D-mannose 3', 5'-epimerase
MTRALIAGGGGFIGGHLAQSLLEDGIDVRCVDIKPLDEWHQVHFEAANEVMDLREAAAADKSVRGADLVFNLAADMGGMGFIENNKALCMLSVLINTHLLKSAYRHDAQRYFFSSSACVYAADKQTSPDVRALKESDAYPAMPEDGYGWEKLFGERMCRHFTEDFDLPTVVVRYHNVYGPHGTYDGGREKAPAAICRKVARAQISGQHEIEIWGDGQQTRSFMYVSDCIYGTRRLMNAEVSEPINLGSSELVSINRLVDLVVEIAGIEVRRTYVPAAPTGVRGRNSDNTNLRATLGWEPSVSLREGLESTYAWIHEQLSSVASGSAPVPR